MPLSMLIQLHILLAMTPALAGWMLATPSQPMMARALAVAVVQIRYVEPDRQQQVRCVRFVKRSVSASISNFLKRAVERASCRVVAILAAAIPVPFYAVAPPALARAP